MRDGAQWSLSVSDHNKLIAAALRKKLRKFQFSRQNREVQNSISKRACDSIKASKLRLTCIQDFTGLYGVKNFIAKKVN
jgi:hypothetical protein